MCSFGVPGGLGYAPCLRITELDCLVSGFAPNTCVLPWRGRECLVRHPHTSPALARGHRLVFCCHRQCILPVGILCCWSAVHFVKMTILSSRLLFIYFCRYFKTAVCHFVPLHTRVWRDFPLGWHVLEALQEGIAYKKRLPLLALGLQIFQREF